MLWKVHQCRCLFGWRGRQGVASERDGLEAGVKRSDGDVTEYRWQRSRGTPVTESTTSK